MAVEPRAEDGPVLVLVEYRVDPARAAEFVATAGALEAVRRRDGAFRWGLFRDLADSGRWVETFLVESWAEHLRQHERHTIEDRAIEEQVRSFHRGESPPAVSHLIWGRAAVAGVGRRRRGRPRAGVRRRDTGHHGGGEGGGRTPAERAGRRPDLPAHPQPLA